MARYDAFGPFRLEHDGIKVTRAGLAAFWKQRAGDSEHGLGNAVGVYIISVQSTRGSKLRPWYVGRTDKQGFQKRFENHELLFRRVLEAAKAGYIQIFLIAMRSPSGYSFRRPTTTEIDQNDWLESTFIGSSLSQNSKLLNVSKTKRLKTMILPGILNTPPGALAKAAKDLQTLVGFKKR